MEHVTDGVCDGVYDGVWLFGKDSFEGCPLTGPIPSPPPKLRPQPEPPPGHGSTSQVRQGCRTIKRG